MSVPKQQIHHHSTSRDFLSLFYGTVHEHTGRWLKDNEVWEGVGPGHKGDFTARKEKERPLLTQSPLPAPNELQYSLCVRYSSKSFTHTPFFPCIPQIRLPHLTKEKWSIRRLDHLSKSHRYQMTELGWKCNSTSRICALNHHLIRPQWGFGGRDGVVPSPRTMETSPNGRKVLVLGSSRNRIWLEGSWFPALFPDSEEWYYRAGWFPY